MTRQFLPPEIDDRYELGDLLGTGASGAVYAATDRQSGSAVAVKVLHQPLVTDHARARFEREIAAHELLADTPGVVQTHAHGVQDQRGWLAMDLHQVTLAERLASAGPLPPAEVVSLLRDCAIALDALHQAGVLHRDLKPSNVFLTSSGSAVLADLGVAQIDGDPTLTGATPLSLQWAAPETIESGESSVETDLYSLGATAFAMLQGSPPFDLSVGSTSDQAIAVGPALRLIASGNRPALPATVGEPLRSLVDDMLAVDPTMRPTSAAQVVDRLRQPSTVVPAAAATNRPTPAIMLGATAVAALVLAALAGWLLIGRGPPDPSAEAAAVAVAPTQSATAVAEPPVAAAATSEPEVSTTAVPAPELSAAEVSTPEVIDAQPNTCGTGVDWCEPLLLDQWMLQGDPQIAGFEQVATEFGPAFALTPGPADEGSYWAERSLAGIGQRNMIAVRFRVRFDELTTLGPDAQSFQTLVTVSDERGANWNVNLVVFPEGIFFNSGYFVPEDLSGGASAPLPHAVDTWHCVELLLTEDGEIPMELFVNGESLIALDDQPAANQGVGFSLSLGPRWLQGLDFAPGLVIADVAVAEEIIGC